MQENKTSLVLTSLFEFMEAEDIPNCVFHSYHELPDRIATDVDICIECDNQSILDTIIWKSSRRHGCTVMQKLYYGIPNLVAYAVYSEAECSKLMQIDFYSDNMGISWLSIPGNAFLKGRQRFKRFFVSEEYMEFLYSLVKRVHKHLINDDHRERLREIYQSDALRINDAIKDFFGSVCLHEIAVLLDVSDVEKTQCCLAKLRIALFVRQYLLKPWKWLPMLWFATIRMFRRVRHPTGLFFCILSPDGGGKSSVSKAVSNLLSGAFRGTTFMHWRPGILPQLKTLVGESRLENKVLTAKHHNHRRRNEILSFIRWCYYSLDYVIGFFLKIMPVKIKNGMVLTERYYYDVIVDPLRYGFYLPQWVLRSILPIIPKPDLSICLDNVPEELHKRKQELPVEELKRQVSTWRRFIPSLPNAKIVTTDKPLNDVVNEVRKLILGRRAEVTRKMLRIDPDDSFHLWKSNLSGGYVALPSKKNCRWLIPVRATYAERTWDVYLPYSRTGQLYKKLLRFISSKGLLGFLKSKRLDLKLADESEALRRCIQNVFQRRDLIPAISAGTPGPYRKITVVILGSDGIVLGYAKVGRTQLAIERVRHEARVLRFLAESRDSLYRGNGMMQVHVPRCLYAGEINTASVIIQSATPFVGRSRCDNFGKHYAEVLSILTGNSTVNRKLDESLYYRNLKQGVECYVLSYRDLLRDGLQCLEDTIGESKIAHALSHGDFVPWNMLWQNGQVFLFDWESARFEAPAGIDLIHFLFQTGFLVKKYRGKRLLNHILDCSHYQLLCDKSKVALAPLRILLLLYLLKMAVDEDKEQILSRSAAERRSLVRLLIGKEQGG